MVVELIDEALRIKAIHRYCQKQQIVKERVQ